MSSLVVENYEILEGENRLSVKLSGEQHALSDNGSFILRFRNHGRETSRVIDVTNQNDDWIVCDDIWAAISSWFCAVSYTHLTLPTKRIV